jgi:hypothetical protein
VIEFNIAVRVANTDIYVPAADLDDVEDTAETLDKIIVDIEAFDEEKTDPHLEYTILNLIPSQDGKKPAR